MGHSAFVASVAFAALIALAASVAFVASVAFAACAAFAGGKLWDALLRLEAEKLLELQTARGLRGARSWDTIAVGHAWGAGRTWSPRKN